MRGHVVHEQFCTTDFSCEWYISRKETVIEKASMAANEGFAYAYGWNLYYEKILGIYEKADEGPIAKQRAWIWVFVMIVFAWLPQTASSYIFWGDMNASIECLSTNLPTIVLIVKIVILQYNRKATSSILVTITEDWLKIKAKKDLDVTMKTAKISRYVSIGSFSLNQIVFFVYVSCRIWVRMQKPDPDMDPRLAFGLLHESYLPFDTTKLVHFVPMWIGQFVAIFVGVLSYSGPDSILTMVVLHVCGQLSIVRYSLKHIVNDVTSRCSKQYWRTIASIVMRHEHLNHHLHSLLIQMVSCSVSLCFQCYAFITIFAGRDRDAPFPIFHLAFFSLYAMDTLIHLFAYCYVGHRLWSESTSLIDDFYRTAWYDLAPNEAKAFLFVSYRSQIPLEIKAEKFCTFNLELFSRIIKTSMGYFSMLMALKNR